MKIMVVGPTHPYRGGISHYNTIMCKTLADKHEVKLISFRRLFPSWLYPGRKQMDTKSTFVLDYDVSFYLDSLNPFSWFNAVLFMRKINPDLLIFQWWTPVLGPIYYFLSYFVKMKRKTKIIFICHNVTPHEHHFFDDMFSKMAFKFSDFFIVHSEEEASRLDAFKHNAKMRKIDFPAYKIFETTSLNKEEAKVRLGIRGDIILFFGFVRPYKGLMYLIDAMPAILDKMNITLLVVGEFWEKKSKYLEKIEQLKIKNQVRIIDDYIPNEEVGIYFSASDLVVLPYVTATQSAVIQLAHVFNKPVVTTSVGGLTEVVINGKTGYIVEPRNSGRIAEVILDFYENKREDSFKRNIEEKNKQFSWSLLVLAIEEFYIGSFV